MRDNEWLQEQLDFLLKNYFSDVKITNPIEIRFGREAKYRFGSIKLFKPRGMRRILGKPKEPAKSVVTVTSMFAREDMPVDIVRYTIAHELCHYAHGFSSFNKRMFKHPHHGGVVNRELAQRGAEDLTVAFKKWLKEYRHAILQSRVKI
ncbi:MAG: hypothetical protein NUV69_05815 [Candidatus Curtissbacteria bacterium]|nr:hypothetical protein [Candidatus Curtissbacteria bacterium]